MPAYNGRGETPFSALELDGVEQSTEYLRPHQNFPNACTEGAHPNERWITADEITRYRRGQAFTNLDFIVSACTVSTNGVLRNAIQPRKYIGTDRVASGSKDWLYQAQYLVDRVNGMGPDEAVTLFEQKAQRPAVDPTRPSFPVTNTFGW